LAFTDPFFRTRLLTAPVRSFGDVTAEAARSLA